MRPTGCGWSRFWKGENLGNREHGADPQTTDKHATCTPCINRGTFRLGKFVCASLQGGKEIALQRSVFFLRAQEVQVYFFSRIKPAPFMLGMHVNVESFQMHFSILTFHFNKLRCVLNHVSRCLRLNYCEIVVPFNTIYIRHVLEKMCSI